MIEWPELASVRIRNSSFSGPQIPIESGFHETGAANSYAGTASRKALRASCNSARASAAPRQWCAPSPNARCGDRSLRSISKRKPSSGWLSPAACKPSNTVVPAGKSRSPTITSLLATRAVVRTAPMKRRDSSIAAGTKDLSTRSFSYCSGWLASIASKDPSWFRVVSVPANKIASIIATSSSTLNRSS